MWFKMADRTQIFPSTCLNSFSYWFHIKIRSHLAIGDHIQSVDIGNHSESFIAEDHQFIYNASAFLPTSDADEDTKCVVL